MAAQPTSINELLRIPAFGTYDNILATHLTNKTTGQGFYMENLGMMDVKTLNSVFNGVQQKDPRQYSKNFGN